jgi:hypothetical protein
VVHFRGRDGATVSIDHPLTKAAMAVLAEVWPGAVSFEARLAMARTRLAGGSPRSAEDARSSLEEALDAAIMGANLIKTYSSSGSLIELRVHAPQLVVEVSERPRASAVARYQARRGLWATNLRHERVVLDEFDRYLLPRVDGRHDCDLLVQEMIDGPVKQRMAPFTAAKEIPESPGMVAQVIRLRLRWLARAGLLEA